MSGVGKGPAAASVPGQRSIFPLDSRHGSVWVPGVSTVRGRPTANHRVSTNRLKRWRVRSLRSLIEAIAEAEQSEARVSQEPERQDHAVNAGTPT